MFSIQQLIKALRKLQSSGELAKSFQHVSAVLNVQPPPPPPPQPSPVHVTSQLLTEEKSPRQQQQTIATLTTATNTTTTTNDQVSSQLHVIIQQSNCQTSHNRVIRTATTTTTTPPQATKQSVSESVLEASPPPRDFSVSVNAHGAVPPQKTPRSNINTIAATDGATHPSRVQSYLRRSQQIQKFYQQQLHHFHTQHQHSVYAKQKQTTFSMSSLAAEPLALKQMDEPPTTNGRGTDDATNNSPSASSSSPSSKSSSANASSPSSTSGRPCCDLGFSEIIKFMELIGNLKHTKRTGWVLREVNDCESISGHMYRMSMMTFLLDGTEGLNRVRCMELALVHDLAESLVGDITPFCGVSKSDKRAMEFKAMEDICNLIEPRGKRIMELFEEYETGESAESKFVKDLDRLDMVMQAFEYEKRDNCLLKHQEFFDSTEGKFNHPFVKKLVSEIYEQRQVLAKAKGATPPPHIDVPSMEDNGHSAATTNGHCVPSSPAPSSEPKPTSS